MGSRRSSRNDFPLMAAVIGWPISHSLSPLLHRIWLQRYDINGYYIPVPCPPHQKQFDQFMRGLQVAGFSGCNITLPHKKNAFCFADTASSVAQSVGAANLLHFSHRGASADNTDCFGFLASLRDGPEGAGADMKGKSALVIGAGGAASAIIKALEIARFRDVTLVNRSVEKALSLQNQYPALINKVCPYENMSDAVCEADLIVNTTSLGMAGKPALELDLSAARKDTVVSDIIYTPLKTPLVLAAEKHGLRVFGGLSMLIHQAVPSFEAFFGVRPEVTGEELRALEKRLTDGMQG